MEADWCSNHLRERQLPGLMAIFLLLVTMEIGRGDNVLEANGSGQNLVSIDQIYSTSTAQPAMLATKGGTILSINDFYTSEHNDGHEKAFCRNGTYNPDEVRPPTGRNIWRRWQFVYTGNARVVCWVVRVPKEINFEHGGLWSDNSMAMLAALFRIQFSLPKNGELAVPPLIRAPSGPDIQ
ncbi:MAG: hypothetical protein JOZ31_14840 [Verrucomicrobia bacterium]|nr:hypothetical protein [Verrucomicrobiota bacterium]MBV8483058.1 hypothetical protein [Verrucomicrobiota bacterium]